MLRVVNLIQIRVVGYVQYDDSLVRGAVEEIREQDSLWYGAGRRAKASVVKKIE